MSQETVPNWLPIPGHEQHSEISQDAEIRTIERTILTSDGRTKVLKSRNITPRKQHGLLYVELYVAEQRAVLNLAKLMATVFIKGAPVDRTEKVIHADGDRENCRACNLQVIQRRRKSGVKRETPIGSDAG